MERKISKFQIPRSAIANFILSHNLCLCNNEYLEMEGAAITWQVMTYAAIEADVALTLKMTTITKKTVSGRKATATYFNKLDFMSVALQCTHLKA